ncbi:MAG: type I-E CRISPR-associated protein Cse2/CasB [Chthoniobacteraceae bacterium]|nr:type I-E CRISPR-associated protein Cse2/CasB [Chthoniobacteraceae bacterium]
MSEPITHPKEEPPIAKLVRLLDAKANPPKGRAPDRGTLALLRAGSRPGSQHLAYAPLADLLNQAGAGASRLDDPVWRAIPTLFAWHRIHTSAPWCNFGFTGRRLAGSDRETFDAHFRRILACDTVDELLKLLPAYVRRAAANSVPINYVRLFWDLCEWRKSPEDAQGAKICWAKAYYSVIEKEPTSSVS